MYINNYINNNKQWKGLPAYSHESFTVSSAMFKIYFTEEYIMNIIWMRFYKNESFLLENYNLQNQCLCVCVYNGW